MESSHALAYVGWEYPPPYGFYTIPPVARKDVVREIWAENGQDHYAVLAADGTLFGVYVFSFIDGVMEMGLGIRPADTGKGLGKRFFHEGIRFGRMRYGYHGKVVLRVAGFNARAIHLYRSAGFVPVGEEQTNSYGVPVTFLVMEREGE